MEAREDKFSLAVQFFLFFFFVGGAVIFELWVGFSLEVGGAIHVNLALF